MTEQQLDGAKVGAGFQQVDGKGMAQRVGRDRLGRRWTGAAPFCRRLHGERRDRMSGQIAGEQPFLGPGGAPVAAQDVEQHGREHHVAVLPPFALLDADDHPLAVDRRRRQADRLGDPQTRRIADGQDDAMLQHVDGIKEPADLVAAQHDRQLMRLAAGGDDLVDVPLPPERDLVEKAQRGDGDQDRTGRELPLLGEMDLVGPNVGGAQQLGRLAEMASEQGDLLDVGALGVRGEVADPHVLDHALAKRRHWQLLCGMKCAKGRHSIVPQSGLLAEMSVVRRVIARPFQTVFLRLAPFVRTTQIFP